MRQSLPRDDAEIGRPASCAGQDTAVEPGSARETRRSARLEMALYGVYEISKLLGSPARLESSLPRVLAVLSNFLDTGNSLIALLGERGDPWLICGSGGNEVGDRAYFDRLQRHAIGRIVSTRMPVVVENAAQDELFAGIEMSAWWQPGQRGCVFIGVPIKHDDRVVGVLTITRDAAQRRSYRYDEDVRFLSMVGNLIGLTVHMHRLLSRDRQLQIAEQVRLAKSLDNAAAATTVRAGRQAPPPSLERIVGRSRPLRAAIEKARIVARSHSTILLRGESGTGKELFAQVIHDLSPRAQGPYIKLNCAALPESVLESELFGHEKGAFTGALALRKGRFELADRGTLFLDEIGEISPVFQAKLLRVLQEGEFERVGGSRTIRSNFRLIAATNRNLEEAVGKGEFRADLYYRISVVPLFLPSLRERHGDIPDLAQNFLEQYNREHASDLTISREAMVVMGNCYFPGNVRELENCVRRTATFVQSGQIRQADLACHQDSCLSSMLWRGSVAAPQRPGLSVPLSVLNAPAAVSESTDPDCASQARAMPEDAPHSERERLIEAMTQAGWVQAKAARLLQLTPRQMGYALRKHAIPIKKF